jgi:hypothetical protein
MKITPTMRRVARDKEFADALAALIAAQDRLREIEMRNRQPRRHDCNIGEPLRDSDKSYISKTLVKAQRSNAL